MTLKTRLQADISSGEINTKQKLLERSALLGLKVTRNGRDYVGLLGPDGKRFRVRFGFADETQFVSPEYPADTGERAASLIVLHEFAEPFGCNGGTAYGDHLFEYMRRA